MSLFPSSTNLTSPCLLLMPHMLLPQAILQHLKPQDFASLCHVSHSVKKCTIQHVPYIILRLSERSRTVQLQQWCQATSGLKHVPAVQVLLVGAVSAEVFDAAMQRLSESFRNIKELQLLGVDSDNHPAKLQTLQPIKHLIARLRTLVVKGFEVAEHGIPWELKQLAEAAAAAVAAGDGWQLQHLVLSVQWLPGPLMPKSRTNWSQFPVALGHLTEAFPDLKHFELTIPAHSYGDVIAGVATAAMLPSYRPTLYHEGLAMRLQTKLVQVAMVASIMNAVERFKSLELLALEAVPDVWASGRAIAAAAQPQAQQLRL